VTTGYLDRLAARTAAVGTVLCVGLDPDVSSLPAGFAPDVSGLERFATLIVDVTTPFAAAFKANLAFYESHGSDGLAILERIRARIPADVPFIADADSAEPTSRVPSRVQNRASSGYVVPQEGHRFIQIHTWLRPADLAR